MVDSSSIGGIEKHIAVLTDSLRRRGIDARIVLLKDHGHSPWITQIESAGLPYQHLDGTLGGLMRVMRADRPALVHTHGYKAGILGRLAAGLLGITRVSTFHMGERAKWPVNLYAAIDNLTSIGATRIAVSGDIQARLPFRAHLIANYLAVPATKPIFAAAPPRIGFVGRLSPEKAPDLFCEIARRIGTQHVSWHIYGDGVMRGELEDRYGGVVHFHGLARDMSDVWPTLGLLVMPSRAEGLPLASIEALSAGIPVIASDVGEMGKVAIAGRSGWTVPPADAAAFATAIGHWIGLSESEKAELRDTSWAHADAHFSERVGLPPVLAIYDRLGVRPAPAPIPRDGHAASVVAG
jgi:glycosyltransferase involved in cell wall biosynthesis